MFDIFSAQSGLEFDLAVFRDIDEAEAWLDSGPPIAE
jgi:hypothetical protein